MKKFISFFCALTIVLSASAVPAHQQRASKMQIQPTGKAMLGKTISPRAEKNSIIDFQKAVRPQAESLAPKATAKKAVRLPKVNLTVPQRAPKADTEVREFDVADAIAAVDAGEVQDGDEIAVHGIITKIQLKGKNFAKYGSASIFVKDAYGNEGEFQFYNCYSFDADTFRTTDPEYDATSTKTESFESVTDGNGITIKVGDEIVAQGKFQLYNGTYELNTGCYIIYQKIDVDPYEGDVEDADFSAAYDFIGYHVSDTLGDDLYYHIVQAVDWDELTFCGLYFVTGYDGITPGVYPINNSFEAGTVLASESTGHYSLITAISNDGYLTAPYWCMVSGTVTVTKDQIIVDALNSKGRQISVTIANTLPPTVADLKNLGFDVENDLVVALQFDEEVCNDVVFVGNYNDWDVSEPESLPRFTPLEGFAGWYVYSRPYWQHDLIAQGKPVQLLSDGSFNWDFQAGDSWGYHGGNQAYIESGYEGEVNVCYQTPGAYIYEIDHWKNHNSPCGVDPTKQRVIVGVNVPDGAPEAGVEIIGSFDNWTGTAMELLETGWYVAFDIEASAIDEFKFREAGTWDNEIQFYDEDNNMWLGLPNFKFGDFWTDDTYKGEPVKWIELDLSDPEYFRWRSQDAPIVPSREEDLVIEDGSLSVYADAWQIIGYNEAGDRYVNIAAYTDVIAGDYIMSQLEWANIAVFTNDTTYEWYNGKEAELKVAYDADNRVANVIGTIIAVSGNDAVKFNVNITAAVPDYDAKDADFRAEFSEYRVDETYLADYNELLVWGWNENDQYINLDIHLPDGASSLVPGVYPINDTWDMQTVYSGNYNGGLYGSYAGNLVYVEESDSYSFTIPVWYLASGEVIVNSDLSITINAKNTHGRSINVTMGAPKQHCGDNLTWELNNGVLTIEGTGAMYDFEELGPWGTEITEVKLPEGITYIGENAFFYCLGLTHVTIPSTVEQIGHYAFCYTGLKTVEIPATVSILGYYSFAYNSALVSVSAAINENLAWYGDVFANCDNIQNLEAPLWYLQQIKSKNLVNVRFTAGGKFSEEYAENLRLSNKSLKALDMSATSLKALPDEALRNCYNLEAVALPANLQVIGTAALAECKLLQAIEIPASVITIGNSAFEDCRSLVDVKFAKNSQLESIGNWAFYNCHDLPAINIPDGVVSIGDGAFYGCVFASTLSLPASIVAIGDNAFALCSKLAEIHVDALLPPDIMDKTFFEVSLEAPVFVPDGSYDAYKNHIYWGRMNIVKNTQGMDQVGSGDKARKIVRDGQLLIIRGDRTFTTTGAEIK